MCIRDSAPAHHAGGQRVQQQRAQCLAVDLRTVALARRGNLFTQQFPGGVVDQPGLLVLVARDRHEGIQQSRPRQRPLTFLRMQVQRAALVARVDRDVRLEHVRAPAMALQDIGQGRCV